LLEDLYVIFKVTPRHRNIARALLKAKYYFHDTRRCREPGTSWKPVAGALLKEIQRCQDVAGMDLGLHYLAQATAGDRLPHPG
jgi:hypothetical protein